MELRPTNHFTCSCNIFTALGVLHDDIFVSQAMHQPTTCSRAMRQDIPRVPADEIGWFNYEWLFHILFIILCRIDLIESHYSEN
jgi:hypothetical protein